MITGLASAVSSLGYGYCICGYSSNGFSVSTPFTPHFAIVHTSTEDVYIGSAATTGGVDLGSGSEVHRSSFSFSSNSVSCSSFVNLSCYYVIF
jgi:hypothetical protein